MLGNTGPDGQWLAYITAAKKKDSACSHCLTGFFSPSWNNHIFVLFCASVKSCATVWMLHENTKQ